MNEQAVKEKIKRALAKASVEIELKRRYLAEDIQFGGYIDIGEEIVGTFMGQLKKTGNYQDKLNLTDKGSQYEKHKSVVFVDVPCRKGDYFTYKGITYRILDIEETQFTQVAALEVIAHA